MSGSTMRKVSVNMSQQVIDALESIAKANNVNMSEAIRRAISTEKFLHDTKNRGGKILIEEPDKSIKQIIIR